MKTVSCLGPAGSYSQLAAEQMCQGGQIVLCKTFPEVIGSLSAGKVDCAVIPIENSIQGGVLQNLDLLERENVFAVEERVVQIDHRLVVQEGVALSDVKKIYSHEQAIGQCSEYLSKNFPSARLIATDSTAKSLSLLDGESAGIVGGHVSKEGLVLSKENIANEECNFTRFLRLVLRGELPKTSEKIFLCTVCEHRPGALLELLRVFADANINLTRIESRPMRGVFGEYIFFIEIKGNLADAAVQDALRVTEQNSRKFRLLGAY